MKSNHRYAIRVYILASVLWMILMTLIFSLSCRTPTTGTSISADVPLTTNVGAGDDDKVARHFDVKAKGESIVIITYHSNDQPEAIDTIYGTQWEKILEILMSKDSTKKQ